LDNVKRNIKNVDDEPCDVPLFNCFYLFGKNHSPPMIQNKPKIFGILKDK